MNKTIYDLYIKWAWLVIAGLLAITLLSCNKPAKEIHTEKTTVDSTWKQEFTQYQSQMLTTFKQQSEAIVSAYKKTVDINKDVNTVTERTFDATTGKMTSEKITKVDKSTYDSMAASSSTHFITIHDGATATSSSSTYGTNSGTSHTVDIKKDVIIRYSGSAYVLWNPLALKPLPSVIGGAINIIGPVELNGHYNIDIGKYYLGPQLKF